MCGQFIIEASTAPDRLDECLRAILQLLREHAQSIPMDELARARRQIAVRRLRAQEKPLRLIEDAALDLFAIGHVRAQEERLAALDDTGREAVRGVFERLLGAGLSLALTGELKRAAGQRARAMIEAAAR